MKSWLWRSTVQTLICVFSTASGSAGWLGCSGAAGAGAGAGAGAAGGWVIGAGAAGADCPVHAGSNSEHMSAIANTNVNLFFTGSLLKTKIVFIRVLLLSSSIVFYPAAVNL
jgi:hypothetical protein